MQTEKRQARFRARLSPDLRALLAKNKTCMRPSSFQEDMKKLRRPNVQPEDGDYFNLNLPADKFGTWTMIIWCGSIFQADAEPTTIANQPERKKTQIG